MHRPECFDAIVAFTRDIGIPVEVCSLAAEKTFLPGIRIAPGGRIRVDPERCHASGDVLHEAGHLAVLTPELRMLADDDVDASLKDVPVEEGSVAYWGKGWGEGMAMAWSYSALRVLGLPPDAVFCPGGYNRPNGEMPAGHIQNLEMGVFYGIKLLSKVGLTDASPMYEMGAPPEGDCPFPNLRAWLVS